MICTPRSRSKSIKLRTRSEPVLPPLSSEAVVGANEPYDAVFCVVMGEPRRDDADDDETGTRTLPPLPSDAARMTETECASNVPAPTPPASCADEAEEADESDALSRIDWACMANSASSETSA